MANKKSKDRKLTVSLSLKTSTIRKLKAEAKAEDVSVSEIVERKLNS